MRTSEKCYGYQYLETHRQEQTILTEYCINCVDGFIFDSMHLVYLGVMKHILEFFISGPGHM